MPLDTFSFSKSRYHVDQNFYDELWQFHRKKVVLKLMPKNKRVLDVGCYDGFYMSSIKDLGNEVFGIDASSDAIYKAKSKGLNVSVGDLEDKWKVKDESFDVVFTGETLEHIVDTDFFILEAKRVLKRGGSLILATPNLATFSKRIMLMLGKNPWQEASFTFPQGAAGHIREFTPDLLRDFIKSKGFDLLKFKSDIVSVPGTPAFFQRLLAVIFPGLGRSLIMEFKKR